MPTLKSLANTTPELVGRRISKRAEGVGRDPNGRDSTNRSFAVPCKWTGHGSLFLRGHVCEQASKRCMRRKAGCEYNSRCHNKGNAKCLNLVCTVVECEDGERMVISE